MAEDFVQNFRLSLMQNVLPVGIAIVERVRKQGANGVVEAFTMSPNPINELRVEGEPLAKSLREKLDEVSPGLGNPVVSVDVSIEDHHFENGKGENFHSLLIILDSIETKVDLLNEHLERKAAL